MQVELRLAHVPDLPGYAGIDHLRLPGPRRALLPIASGLRVPRAPTTLRVKSGLDPSG